MAEEMAESLGRSVPSRHPKGWFRETQRQKRRESRSQRFRERLLEIIAQRRDVTAEPSACDAIALWRESRRNSARSGAEAARSEAARAEAARTAALRTREQRDLERAIRESRLCEGTLQCGLTASEVEQLLTRDLSPEDYDLLLKLDEALAPRDAVAPEIARKALNHETTTVSGSSESPDGGCRICLEDAFEIGAEISRTKCEHFFHTNCLVTWCSTHNRCPLCSAPIV